MQLVSDGVREPFHKRDSEVVTLTNTGPVSLPVSICFVCGNVPCVASVWVQGNFLLQNQRQRGERMWENKADAFIFWETCEIWRSFHLILFQKINKLFLFTEKTQWWMRLGWLAHSRLMFRNLSPSPILLIFCPQWLNHGQGGCDLWTHVYATCCQNTLTLTSKNPSLND